jgi:hypothetical protein
MHEIVDVRITGLLLSSENPRLSAIRRISRRGRLSSHSSNTDVEWGALEKARFQERHSGKRKPAMQVVDFVEKSGHLSEAAHEAFEERSCHLAMLAASTRASASRSTRGVSR